MATHQSALKRVRQTRHRTEVNRGNLHRLRTQIKNLRKLITAGNAVDASRELKVTLSLVDASVNKGIIHRNAANRYKSRLTKHVGALVKKTS